MIIGNSIIVPKSNVYAFAHIYWAPGSTVDITNGTKTIKTDTSGDYIAEIPSGGHWTFTFLSGYTLSLDISYGSSVTAVDTLSIHSLVPTLSSLTGSNGTVIYNSNVNYYWSSSGDSWKAFDGNTSSHGEYHGENQSGYYIGYQFNSKVYVYSIEFYGGNYSTSDYFDVIVEYLNDSGSWITVETFQQAQNGTTAKTIPIREYTTAVRLRSPTEKTSGHNLFIREIVINGYEVQ